MNKYPPSNRRLKQLNLNINPVCNETIKNICVIHVCCSHGQPIIGCEQGSILMKKRGLLELLILDCHSIANEKYLSYLETNINYQSYNSLGNNIKNAYSVGSSCYDLYIKTLSTYENNMFPIIIGGDHSIACGSISAALSKQPNIGIIWIDAHADINTPDTSISMNIHGMPLSFLLGLVDCKNIQGFEWMNDIPKINPHNLIHIGLRDIDESENKILKELNIKSYSMDDIKSVGIEKIMINVLSHFSDIDDIHVSWDIDSIDPIYAPCTGTKVKDGLSLNEAFYIANEISKTNKLISMDMVEINPLIVENSVEDSNKTADIANYLIRTILK